MNIETDDKVLAYINVEDLKDEDFLNNHYIMMCTKKVLSRKTPLERHIADHELTELLRLVLEKVIELLEARLTNGEMHM